MDESHKFGRHQGRLKTLLDAPISTSQHALPRSGFASRKDFATLLIDFSSEGTTSALGHKQTNRPSSSRVCLCSLNRLQSVAKLLPRRGVIGGNQQNPNHGRIQGRQYRGLACIPLFHGRHASAISIRAPVSRTCRGGCLTQKRKQQCRWSDHNMIDMGSHAH
jgi:hypothetical protein